MRLTTLAAQVRGWRVAAVVPVVGFSAAPWALAQVFRHVATNFPQRFAQALNLLAQPGNFQRLMLDHRLDFDR